MLFYKYNIFSIAHGSWSANGPKAENTFPHSKTSQLWASFICDGQHLETRLLGHLKGITPFLERGTLLIYSGSHMDWFHSSPSSKSLKNHRIQIFYLWLASSACAIYLRVGSFRESKTPGAQPTLLACDVREFMEHRESGYQFGGSQKLISLLVFCDRRL